mmetsp:Transcript_21165/g.59535  ORF Transcript_21165/g.59535 Transcript_21165/m.59535 type:complete len:353 (+) Transcript_21165:612-1670(+)
MGAGRLDPVLVELREDLALQLPLAGGPERLVEQLDAPARVPVRGARPAHRLDRLHPEVEVVVPWPPLGQEEDVVVAVAAARVHVAALAPGGAVQVQQHLQAGLLREEEDLVDPLRVVLGGHDPVQAAPPVPVPVRAVRRPLVRQVDQVPVPEGQPHDVEAELRHGDEVLGLDVRVQEARHPLPCVRRREVAEAHCLALRLGHPAEEHVVRAQQAQEVLRDEAAPVVHAPHRVLRPRLPQARAGVREVAPDEAGQLARVRVAVLAAPPGDLVVLQRVPERRGRGVGAPVLPDLKNALAVLLRRPLLAPSDAPLRFAEPLVAEPAVAGVRKPPATVPREAVFLRVRQAFAHHAS